MVAVLCSVLCTTIVSAYVFFDDSFESGSDGWSFSDACVARTDWHVPYDSGGCDGDYWIMFNDSSTDAGYNCSTDPGWMQKSEDTTG